jgi:Flp pilus assembly protein TadG
MEFALTLPILLVVLLALCEFSMLFFARGDVVEAARVGARHASLDGATTEDVEQVVKRALGPRLGREANVQVDCGLCSGDAVAVAVWVPMAHAAPNLLWPIGYDIDGEMIHARSQAVRE